jgi:tetratricopeptide (TPR) repeat protein
MKVIILVCSIFCLTHFSVFSQKKQTDSLRVFLRHTKSDTGQARLYFDIGTLLQSNYPDSAIFYYNKVLHLLSKNNSSEIFPSYDKINSPSSVFETERRLDYANALNSISWVFGNNKGLNDTAVFIAQKALSICLNIHTTKNPKLNIQIKNYLAIGYNTIASEYNNLGNFDKAKEFYTKALTILEEIKLNISGISNCYMNLGIVYDEQGQYQKALEYYYKALRINKNPVDKTICCNCYSNMGIVFWEMAEYDKAIEYYTRALKINQELGKKPNIAYTYNNIGLIYREKGSYLTAIEYFQKALKINEELNSKSNIADNYCNIGIIHLDMLNLDNALDYFQKALKEYIANGGKDGIALCYNNIATIYNDRHQWDIAIDYLKKSIAIREEMHDIFGLATNYSNLGSNYLNQGKTDLAKEYFQKAISMYLELNAKNELAILYNNVADLHYSLKEYDQAIIFANKGLVIAKETGTLPNENTSYKILKKTYSSLGQTKKALEYAELFILSKDSLFKEEKTKAITEMETKYQSEKKQLEIDKLGKEKELQTSEMKKQKLIILFVVCGLLFVLVFAVVLFRLFIQKKKANKIITEKNEALQMAYEEINTQKEEIIVQRDSLQEQKEIIVEHQKEIEDSINYALRIQQATLPDFGQLFNTGTQYSVNSNQNTEHRLPNTDYFILFNPKDIVSGDFYWATQINEWLIITVADCTGHGVPGAFMSMLGISFINEIVRKKEVTKAADVLDQLRTSVIDALKQKGDSGEQKDGMDISLCAINTNTLEMQYAGANNPCWIVNSRQSAVDSQQSTGSRQQPTANSQLLELKPDKQPIGIHTNMQPFSNQHYQLQKGDILYLMSDGYEDQFGGPNRKKFLSKNLKNLLIANSQLPMPDQKQTLETTIKNWIGNEEQIDDITLLGLKL